MLAHVRGRNGSIPGDLQAIVDKIANAGGTPLVVVDGALVLGVVYLKDTVKPGMRERFERLRAMGIKTVMVTGDNPLTAKSIAAEAGVDDFLAEATPEAKLAYIHKMQEGGRLVAMTGDGTNDAPALAQADVGIAIGAGTDVARAAAGIVLVRNDPRDITRIVQLSRASYRKMLQNLAWAVGYNALALPLAAGVAAPLGLVLPAWVGAVLMSASTIVVALNAQLLRRLDLRVD